MRARPTVQLRYKIDVTGEQYVTQKAWKDASLPKCPLHPRGGWRFSRHGTYTRVKPPGTLVARWYCPEGHCTFSLLPDCLAARMSGTVVEIEEAVKAAEQAGSQEKACDSLRLETGLQEALRWLGRRLTAVRSCLSVLKGLVPDFAGCPPPLATAACSYRIFPPPIQPRCSQTPKPTPRKH